MRNRVVWNRRSVVSMVALAALGLPIVSLALGIGPQAVALKAEKPADTDKVKVDATELVAKVLDAIVSTDGLKGLDETLAGKDRDRVGAALQARHESFVSLATEFRNDWKRKYDDQFDARTHTGVLSTDRVEIVDKGSEHFARVFFDAHGGDPAFELHLVREKAGDFRLNLPDSLSGEKMASRLETALRALIANKADWPKEESVGYAQLTRKLMHPLRWETLAEKKGDDKHAAATNH
jgi:hypothetical protein